MHEDQPQGKTTLKSGQPKSKLTRRQLLATGAGLAAAGASGLAAPAVEAKMSSRTSLQADFIVVGAGYAGMTAALRLQQAGKSVIVLEARHRVGGRVFSHKVKGAFVEFGGTWLAPFQTAVWALTREMGVHTFPTYDRGDNIFVSHGKPSRVSAGSILQIDPTITAALVLAVEEFEGLARTVPLQAPWKAARAHEWDGQTVETWVQTNLDPVSPEAAQAFRFVATGFFNASTAQLSLLNMMWFIHTHGGFLRLLATKGGAQQDRWVEGAQAVPNRIAAQLGNAVHLNTPVRRISQDRTGVDVHAENLTVRGRRVIVAVPITLTGDLVYDPAMVERRALLTAQAPAGSVIKAAAMYKEPFWRSEGLTGQSAAFDSDVTLTLDASPPSGHPGILVAFASAGGALKVHAMKPAARRRIFLAALRTRFGPKAATPIYYADHDWAAEKYTRGCYMSHFPTGVLTGFGAALRAPVGRIHWAGTDISGTHNGSIDGAVVQGNRVAREVIRAG